MEGQELCWRERGRLWMRIGIRLLLTALSLGLLVQLGPPVFSLFMPFFLALFAAWMLNPLVRWFQKRVNCSRRLLSLVLILVILAGLGGILIGFFWNIAGEIVSLANNWSGILDTIAESIDVTSRFFSRLMVLLPEQIRDTLEALLGNLSGQLFAWLKSAIPTFVSNAASAATGIARRVPSFAIATVVFLMGSFYLTADYPHIRYLVSNRFSGRLRVLFGEIRTAAISAFGGYVKAEFILSVGVFFILVVGFTIMSQPYALLLAFLFSVLDFIPIVGSGTIMIPWAVVRLFMRDLPTAVELMIIWGIIVLFRRIMEPKIVGDQTGLPPVISLISIYVGMKVAGVLGMILAPVVCMVVWNICKLGIFTPFLEDLRLAVEDLTAFMRNRPTKIVGNSKKD